MKSTGSRPAPSAALAAVAGLMAFSPVAPMRGETFFWNLPEGTTGAFDDPANWSLERPGGAPAPRVPDRCDSLSDATGYDLDLGGQTCDIGRWEQVTWEPRTFRITNGTLRVHDAMELHSGRLEIEENATLRFEYGSIFYPGKNDVNPREVNVRGKLRLYCERIHVYNMDLTVHEGGCLEIFRPKFFAIDGRQKSLIRNEGEMIFRSGLVVDRADMGGTLRIENSPKGTMVVEGDIGIGGHKAKLEVSIEGGTLILSRDFSSHVTSARFGDGADVEIVIPTFGRGVLTEFTFGKDVRLEKKGGSLVLSSLPAQLTVKKEGTLVLAPPHDGKELVIDPESVTLERDTVLVLAGNRIRLDKFPAEYHHLYHPLYIKVDPALVSPDEPMLLSTDPAVLDAVAAKLKERTLPDGVSVERREDALWLRVSPRATFWMPRAPGAPAPHFKAEADRANRCFRIDAVGFGEEVEWFEYKVESEVQGPKFEVQGPVGADLRATRPRSDNGAHRRFRFPRSGDEVEPVRVKATIHTREWGDFTTNFVVRPNPSPIRAPDSDLRRIKVGMSVDINDTRLHCEAVTNEMANLLVCGGFDTPTLDQDNYPPEVREKIARDRISMMTIYAAGRESPALLKKFRNQYGDQYGARYLGNNIGEYCGYLYQTKAEALAASVPQDHDVLQAKERFIEEWMHKGATAMLEGRPYLITTSGSPLANYELQGGADFVCTELYAVGSANLAYATSEARGAARRWKPEYWMGWLAEEWQSLGIPYNVPQKQALLKAGFLQEWLMGTSVMVLESGPLGTRAEEYTAPDPDTGVTPKEGYDGKIAQAYRKTVKEFYDFTRKHMRAKNSPDTHIAFALGNGDSFVGMSVDWFAVWGLHGQAETNANYRYGAPEFTWLRAQDTFFPRGPEALAPYPNAWLAGSPYGQIDIVGVDEDSLLSDLSRYTFVAFAGWNTMTLQARDVLEEYVRGGGTLALCVPHLSTRADREYRNYAPADLLQPFCGTVVTGPPETATGPVAATDAAPPALREALAGIGEATVRLAPLELPDGAEVLATVGGKPLLVRATVGEGAVHLFAAWDYPGKDGPLAEAYNALLRTLAAAVPQRVRIAPAGDRDDTAYIAYAVYSEDPRPRAYVLNLDCIKPRRVRILIEGRDPEELVLEPVEMRTIRL